MNSRRWNLHRVRAGLLAAALCAGLTPAPAGAHFTFQKVALETEPAPDTEPGTVFGPLNDVYVTSVPSLDANGTISFVATLTGPQVTPANHTGIWSWNAGTLGRVARAGQFAPGTTPDASFGSFPLDFALTPPRLGGGRLAFAATVSGPGIGADNDEGSWALDGSTLRLVARESAPAPGLAAGVLLGPPSLLDLDPAGHAFLISQLRGTGIGSANDESFWSDRSGALALVLREGGAAPDLPGLVIGGAGQFLGTGYTFGSITWSRDSRLALEASVTGPGVTYEDNEGVFLERANGFTLVAREGAAAPGSGGGATFGGNSVTADFSGLTVNRLEQVAFVARVGGASSLTYALFSTHTGALTEIARPGQPAPGMSGILGIVTDALLNDSGRLAFRSAVGNTSPLQFGAWWNPPGAPGVLAPVAIPGDPDPDRPGAHIESVDRLLAFNTAGQVAFLARLDDQRTALFLSDVSGGLHEVVATGDAFDVLGSDGSGADVRTVEEIHFGALDEAGVLALRLDFADGRFGIYRATASGTTAVGEGSPAEVQLGANVPNPFANSTRLEFTLPRAGHVQLAIFDAAGRRVRGLLDDSLPAGPNAVAWDARNDAGARVAPGVYHARLVAGAASRAISLVVLPAR